MKHDKEGSSLLHEKKSKESSIMWDTMVITMVTLCKLGDDNESNMPGRLVTIFKVCCSSDVSNLSFTGLIKQEMSCEIGFDKH